MPRHVLPGMPSASRSLVSTQTWVILQFPTVIPQRVLPEHAEACLILKQVGLSTVVFQKHVPDAWRAIESRLWSVVLSFALYLCVISDFRSRGVTV